MAEDIGRCILCGGYGPRNAWELCVLCGGSHLALTQAMALVKDRLRRERLAAARKAAAARRRNPPEPPLLRGL